MVWGTKVYIARQLLSTPYTWWDRALNLAAECAHVEQFQRWGKLGFARRWLWQVLTHLSVSDIPIEDEMHTVEDAFMAWANAHKDGVNI